MRNFRLIVLGILSVIFLSLLFVLSQKDQMKGSSSQIGHAANSYKKQVEVNSKTKTPKRVVPTKNREATVEVNGLNVRDKPSLSSQVVGNLDLGSKITVIDEQSGWAEIGSSSGLQGWVYKTYITKDTATAETASGKTVVPTPTTGQDSEEPLKGKTIVLDPGHGGNDIGTTSIVGTFEKTLTLATAQVVEQKLKNAGANVIMTRTKDTYIPLEQRVAISNQNHADAFISFHYNWVDDPSINGLTDFYYQKSKDKALSSDILNEIVQTTGLNNDGTRFDDLDVLRNNSQPCTLIELGFLSNKQDDSVVESSSYLDNVAEGVYLGLLDYFSNKNQVF